jgi:hypothetical protein
MLLWSFWKKWYSGTQRTITLGEQDPNGGNIMGIVTFFGGILLGFFLGFTGMALLSAMNYRLQCQELEEVQVCQKTSPYPED